MTINQIPGHPLNGQPFPRGARPSPRHKLLAAVPHVVVAAPPPQIAYVPKKLSYWLNDRYGICVTAEEAFAKACYDPEILISDAEAKRWAQSHGVLNGADLSQVLDWMKQKGFVDGPQRYDDGANSGVDFSNETVLQSAIAQGPVKIAIAADALPSGAGNHSGWFSLGDQRAHRTDHCVALCGYGPADWLYQQLDAAAKANGGAGVALPSGLPAKTFGYLLFTWSTIGFVDHAWIMGTTDEAWVRNPTTIGVPPLPTPVPPTPPGPVPQPVIGGSLYAEPFPGGIAIRGEVNLESGKYKYIAVPDRTDPAVTNKYKLVDKPVI